MIPVIVVGEVQMIKKALFFTIFIISSLGVAHSQSLEVENYSFEPIYIKVDKKTTSTKTKFYNFDDLLINGEYKKPQVLYSDSKQKVKFDRLLKLKKSLLPKLKNTQKDPTLR